MKVGSDAFHKKECFDSKSSDAVLKQNTMNYDKAKQALTTLQREKQAQQIRLQLAALAKQELDNNINRINTLRP